MSTVMSRTKGLITRKNDPKIYGAICSHCSKRYSAPLPGGYIELIRCSNCPPFKYITALSEQSSGRSGSKIARDKKAYLKKREAIVKTKTDKISLS